jgi:hypothetical protein
MTDFITSPDPQELPPPFRFPAVSMTTFAIDLGMLSGMPALTSYCDTYLGVDPDVRYRPLTPVGYLCILDYPKMYCDAPGYDKWGYVPQKEVFFTFPVIRSGRAVGNIFLPTEVSWAMPFIAVNNPTSAVTGRMVLGFQKIYGNIDKAWGIDGSFSTLVSLPTFESMGREVEQQYEPIVSVRSGPPNPIVDAVDHSFPWSLLGHNQIMDYVENTSMHLLENLIPGLLEVVNLKQMRGAQFPDRAVYQALVQSRMTFKNMTAPVFYQNPEFMVYPNASMDFGVNDPELAKLEGGWRPALAAFTFTVDMTLDDVRDLYVAPAVKGTRTGGLFGELRAFWGPYFNDLRLLLFPFA